MKPWTCFCIVSFLKSKTLEKKALDNESFCTCNELHLQKEILIKHLKTYRQDSIGDIMGDMKKIPTFLWIF